MYDEIKVKDLVIFATVAPSSVSYDYFTVIKSEVSGNVTYSLLDTDYFCNEYFDTIEELVGTYAQDYTAICVVRGATMGAPHLMGEIVYVDKEYRDSLFYTFGRESL